AVAGIGRAVQVVKRDRWEETLQRGEFPSLGQLDLDLDVPRPAEAQPFRQRLGRPLGLPFIEARGRLDGRAMRRLASTILRLLRGARSASPEHGAPPVIVLDAREPGEPHTPLPLLASLLQSPLHEARIQLWIVADLHLLVDGAARLFTD